MNLTLSLKSLLCLSILSLWIGCQPVNLIPETIACTENYPFELNASHPKGAAIQATMDKYIRLGLPGMTILISDDDGIWVASAGFADLENQIPMQPCHINKLGSITKMMMGTLIWQYISEGKLSLNEPIQTYIPEVSARITNGSEITLGMLLNHTSGIADIGGDLNFNLAVVNDFTYSWTAEEILEFIADKPATHAPGTALRYSNTNTMLEGMILDAVTGRPHRELLQERIFDRLGMNQTVYYNYSQAFPYENIAQGYLDFHNDGGDIQNISLLNPGSGNGYTGVYSTVSDLYRFMNALLREKTLTSPENLEYIFDNFFYFEGQSWASSYGAIHDEYREVLPDSIHTYGHTGGDIGYSANLNYFPHNNTIFAATYNYGTNLPSPLGDALRELRKELFLIMAE